MKEFFLFIFLLAQIPEPPIEYRMDWNVYHNGVFIISYDFNHDDKADFYTWRLIDGSEPAPPECAEFRETRDHYYFSDLDRGWIYQVRKRPFKCKTDLDKEWHDC